jgi:hypothetical protein
VTARWCVGSLRQLFLALGTIQADLAFPKEPHSPERDASVGE